MTVRRTVLVTGGCGFIGSHVAERLIADGDDVVVVDDLSTGTRNHLPCGATFYSGSVVDRLFLEKVFARHRFDAVIHEAARINTSILTEQPPVDVRISVDGTINLIEIGLAAGIRKFLYASSVAVYGRPITLPATEETPPAPIYSYGIAKLCAEEYVRFYGSVHGLDYHILRYGNVYGPRQPVYGEVGVISIFTGKVLRNEPLTVYGDGSHKRDFIFITDAVDATVKLLDLPGSDTFNVAAGAGIRVNEIFESFQRVCGGSLARTAKPERLGEIGQFYCSTEKLARRLNWRTSIPILEGIRQTIEHCRNE